MYMRMCFCRDVGLCEMQWTNDNANEFGYDLKGGVHVKQQMDSFSYGLFAAGIIIIIAFFVVDQPKKNAKEMTIDDMIDEMKDEGYRVISEAEYISLAVNEDSDADANDEEDAEKDDRKSDDQDSQEKDKQSSSKDEGDDKKKQDS